MSEKTDLVTYSQKHISIITSGVDDIREALAQTDVPEIRSVLLCLDKYLDPYFGYDLPYFNEIITLLEEQLFQTQNKEIKSDILELLSKYAKTLDHLAENLKGLESEPELLEEALYTLGNTYNQKYLPSIIPYELDHRHSISFAAKEVATDLSKQQ